MDRVRRISSELLTKYPERFSDEFDENKKMVNELAKIRSKVLRNKIAGNITAYNRKHSEEMESSMQSSEVPAEVSVEDSTGPEGQE